MKYDLFDTLFGHFKAVGEILADPQEIPDGRLTEVIKDFDETYQAIRNHLKLD